MTITGPEVRGADTYQWYKDGAAISQATTLDYTISNASSSDAGEYVLKAYSDVLTDLVIESEPITVKVQIAPPKLEVSPTSVDFGSVEIGEQAVETLSILNRGESDLLIREASFSGPDADDFQVDEVITASLSPGESRDVEITFAPDRTDFHEASLDILSNGGDVTVSLTGSGAEPILTVSSNSLDFGTVAVGSEAIRTLTIENTGGADLIISEAGFFGDDVDDFWTDDEITRTLPPGQSRDVDIVFAPSRSGQHSASLQIGSNGGNATVDLTGNGQDAVLSVTPQSIDFGDIRVGDRSVRSLTIENRGGADLVISDASFSGADASDFAAEDAITGTLPPGESREVGLSFVPSRLGNHEATLQITSNVGDTGVELTARGTEPDLRVVPLSFDFGDVAVGDEAASELLLENTGGAELHITSAAFTGANADAFSAAEAIEGTLAPGAVQRVDIRFAPTDSGAHRAELHIESDGGEATLALVGRGIAPSMEVTPAMLEFGGVAVGGAETRTIAVENSGIIDVELFSSALSGDDADAFSISGEVAGTLGPGASIEISVTFAPGRAGAHSASLELTSSARDVSIPLSGTGFEEPSLQIAPIEATIGVTGTFAVDVVGSPTPSLSLVSGPDGLTLDAGTRTLTWTPTAAQYGGHEVVLRAQNEFGEVQVEHPAWVHAAVPEFVTHDNGTVQFSALNTGKIGRDILHTEDGVYQGEGFVFESVNGLFEGSLVLATDPDNLVGRLFNFDYSSLQPIEAVESTRWDFDTAYETVFEPRRGLEGLEVLQRTHSSSRPGNLGFVIVEYEITNRGTNGLNNLYVGTEMGWDIPAETPNDDLGGYDADRSLSYMYDGSGGANTGYYGVSLLGIDASGQAIWPNADEEHEPGRYFERLASFTPNPAEAGDYCAGLATGPFDLPAGEMQRVVFAIVGGENLAALQANADAAARSEETVGPVAATSPDPVVFEATRLGTMAEGSFTVENTGDRDLVITGGSISGEDASAFTLPDDVQGTIEPGASQNVRVTFTPERSGEHTAAVELATNADRVSVALSGSGAEPMIALDATSIGFGEVLLSSEGEVGSVTVSNSGTADLDLTGASVSGAAREDFDVLFDGALPTLAPGSSHPIEINFTPRSEGTRTASLTISSNAGDAEVSLTGSGAVPDVQPSPVNSPTVENDVDVSVVAPSTFRPTTRELRFRPTGETTYRSVTLETTTSGNGAARLTATIPGSFVSERGVQYYYAFSNGATTITVPREDAEQNPFFLPVRVQTATPSVVMQAEAYTMVSVPLLLDDATPAAVFEAYGSPHDSVWRLLRWDPAENRYDEFPDDLDETIAPGLAFWLITRDGVLFEVSEGVSVSAAAPYEITLAPGFNQIGTPYAFPVAWSDIEASGPVERPVAYNPASEDSDDPWRYGQTTVRPWEGYFVNNASGDPVTMRVPPREDLSAGKHDAASPVPAEAEYGLQLMARLGTLSDTQNFIGFAPAASDGYDDLDFHEAPPIGAHVRLSVVEGERRLAGSFRPPTSGGAVWNLELVSSGTAEGVVSIQLEEFGVKPDGYGVVVQDVDRERVVPIEPERFGVALDGAEDLRRLRLIIGTDAFAEANKGDIPLVPVEFGLDPNYPNPFGRETTIPYQLAEKSRVVLDIYNALGRRIRRIVRDEQPAGSYVIAWDGRSDDGAGVASGTYFYRLRAGSFTGTRQMLLIR